MKIEVNTAVERTVRVRQLEGMFDLQPSDASTLSWDVDVDTTSQPWNVGLIVGPSGAGKSTIAKARFEPELEWAHDVTENLRACRGSILDAFPPSMGIKDIVGALSAVGFSSPPAWLRPFHALSNGEQFRVTMAALLAYAKQYESGTEPVIVVDEFTSVVDRTVARVGAHALAKAVRREGLRFVAVTCHEDVLDWLQPEWVVRPAEQSFAWRSVQPRPRVDLTFYRVGYDQWARFRHAHYLSHDHSKAAECFAVVADFGGDMGKRLVAWSSWLPFVGHLKDGQKMKRTHRTVCLPDYQGIGLGNAVQTFLASMYKGLGYRAVIGTSHPAFIAGLKRSSDWIMTKAPSMRSRDNDERKAASRAADRLMASFEFVGTPMDRVRALRVQNNWRGKL